MLNKYQVVVIGGGPAGCACAIQLKRYGIDCIIIEKNRIGGLLWNANLIENYMGFPIGVRGSQLIQLINDHLEYTKTPIIFDEVKHCTYADYVFTLKLKETTIQADYLVLANGTVPKKPFAEITEEAAKRMFYEVADTNERAYQHFAIIGSGDAAFDYAINLSQYGTKSDIFCRTSEIKAIPLLAERSKTIPGINVYLNHSLTKVVIDGEKLRLTFESDGMMKEVEVDYIIFAIGREPDFSIFSESINSKREELIKEEKLVFIGDCVNGMNRQSSIASGMGINSAMNIYRKINS
jgi:thioredoxin reductase (NADPH)